MIERVWGLVNSVNVTFTPSQSADRNPWTFDPPDLPRGYYAVEVWAENDIGQIAYRAALLWVSDGNFTCLEWVHSDYEIKYLNYDFECRDLPSAFKFTMSDNDLTCVHVADALSIMISDDWFTCANVPDSMIFSYDDSDYRCTVIPEDLTCTVCDDDLRCAQIGDDYRCRFIRRCKA